MQQIQRVSGNDAEQNQFLSQYMDYESCPFCARSFFRGKLAFHLKLCNRQNPMSKNNSSTPRQKIKKNAVTAATCYERCSFCNSRIPSFLIAKHQEKCSRNSEGKEEHPMTARQKDKRQTKFKATFNPEQNLQEETIFPRLRNFSSKEPDQNSSSFKRDTVRSTMHAIKVRDQLRCFRRAQQVQKVECESCGRKFSEKAALRHIPICSMLRKKQQQEIALSRKFKSVMNQSGRKKISKTVDLVKQPQSEQLQQSIILNQSQKCPPSEEFSSAAINARNQMIVISEPLNDPLAPQQIHDQ